MQDTCETQFVDECLSLTKEMWQLAEANPCGFRAAELKFLRDQLKRDERMRAPAVKGLLDTKCQGGVLLNSTSTSTLDDADTLTKEIENEIVATVDNATSLSLD